MFEKDYKNQIDKIKPDRYIKNKVREKMAAQKTPRVRKGRRAVFGAAVAAVLCCALLLPLGLYSRLQQKNQLTDTQTPMKTANDYTAIYRQLKTLIPKDEIYYEFGTDFNDGTTSSSNAGITNSPTAGTGGTENKGSASQTNRDNIIDQATDSNTNDHSDTNTQVAGVDEADIVKTDGRYIYILSNDGDGRLRIKIVDTADGKPKQLSSIEIDDAYCYNPQMYLSEHRLIVVGSTRTDTKKRAFIADYADFDKIVSTAMIYDISDPTAPKTVERCTQSGEYTDSRLIGKNLYLITDFSVYGDIKKNDYSAYIPSVSCKEYDGVVNADTVHFYNNCTSPVYTVVSAYDITDGTLASTQSVLGGTFTVYAGTNDIITAGAGGNDTQIARFAVNDGQIELKATATLKGTLLNQFSIDEYQRHFRFVLTDYNVTETVQSVSGSTQSSIAFAKTETANSLVILDENLKETGKITDLAKNERVYSVRFMGDIAYFVTFRQVDPLFSADLSDPANPKIIGSLKIPGFSNYLFPFGDKLLGIGMNADEKTGRTEQMKLSLFDISDPANVTESAKTTVPADWSDALYNHKASLVDGKKNLIGFTVYGEVSPAYLVYSFENGKFVQRLSAALSLADEDYSNTRGLYIGNTFYVVNGGCVHYFALDSFAPLGTLNLK